MIDITLLGTGGGMPMPNRFLSSIIINYKGRKILLDCGEGTQVSMKILKTGFRGIDIILISHYHGDHIFGLPGLLSTMGNSERTKPVAIIGPPGIGKVIEGLLLSLPYLPFKIDIIENPLESMEISMLEGNLKVIEGFNEESLGKDITLSFLELDHSSPCLGFSLYINRKPEFLPERAKSNEVPMEIWGKLQNGEDIIYNNKRYNPDMVLGKKRKGIKITYITDTRPLDSIIDFVSGSDLFICEGTYGDNEDLEKAINNKHMTFAEASTIAYKGKVRELLLTHFSTAMDDPNFYEDNAKNIFSNTIIGYDGLKKTLIWN